MKKIAEFLIKNFITSRCPSDISLDWERFEPELCDVSKEGCRECWANVEKHLEREQNEKRNQ